MFSDLSFNEMTEGRNLVTTFRPVHFLIPEEEHIINQIKESIIYLWEVARYVTVFENNCILCVVNIYVKIKSYFF